MVLVERAEGEDDPRDQGARPAAGQIAHQPEHGAAGQDHVAQQQQIIGEGRPDYVVRQQQDG